METELMKISHIKYLETKITFLKNQLNASEQIAEKFKPKYHEMVFKKYFYNILVFCNINICISVKTLIF